MFCSLLYCVQRNNVVKFILVVAGVQYARQRGSYVARLPIYVAGQLAGKFCYLFLTQL